jgi:hypothetical protein
VEIMSVPLSEGASSEKHELLRTTIKTSSPQDLSFAVTAECSILTSVLNQGNSDSSAEAKVRIWVEFNGNPVAVSSDDTEDTGKVVFCNRSHRQVTSDFDDEDATIQQIQSTKSANAFNWILINAGQGTHDVVVYADIEAQVTGVGEAQGGVAKRTLVVEPQHLQVDATI